MSYRLQTMQNVTNFASDKKNPENIKNKIKAIFINLENS